ncbi:helix-turn-helix domain-containing protein [Actinoplanes sp. NPDC051494]|uniref:helix-turn-helix domain-containing protein n=1 Tax=Actinoplanes sp. NPDC051494 TaxID=3363907 RepID=UPI0037A78C87
MSPSEPRELNDVRELKALSHPLRVRLYYALSAEEAATATRLAELVDESPALVSYHLRQLAAHGLIAEAPDRSPNQRERWWRLSSTGFRWSQNDFSGTPEQRAASAAVKRLLLENHLMRLRQFEEEQPSWGPEWTSASFSSDALLRLTHAELAQLQQELQAVIHKWAEAGRAATDDDGREHVMTIMHGFPYRP